MEQLLEIRGSEVGLCPRYLSIKALGGELEGVPGWLQKIFDSGKDQEGETIAWLEKEYGEPVVDQQREVREEQENVCIVGHIDGVQDNKLVEIKALGEQKRALLAAGGLEALPIYLAQVNAYYAAMPDMDGLRFAVKHWEKDEYIVLEFDHDEMVEIGWQIGDTIATKLESVRLAVEMGEPIPVPSDLDDYNCATCPARFHCYEDLLEQSMVLSSNEQDIDLMAAYQFYQQMNRVAENIKQRVQDYFAGRLAEEEAKKISTAMGSATLVKQVRSRFDKKKAKELLGVEQFAECESKVPSEFVKISVRSEK